VKLKELLLTELHKIFNDIEENLEKLHKEEYRTYQEVGSDRIYNEYRPVWQNKIAELEQRLFAMDEAIDFIQKNYPQK